MESNPTTQNNVTVLDMVRMLEDPMFTITRSDSLLIAGYLRSLLDVQRLAGWYKVRRKASEECIEEIAFWNPKRQKWSFDRSFSLPSVNFDRSKMWINETPVLLYSGTI